MYKIRKFIVLALAIIFSAAFYLGGCFSQSNTYYDTGDIISSVKGWTWHPDGEEFNENSFGNISAAKLTDGGMDYNTWSVIELNFKNSWGDNDFGFLIFAIEAQNVGELHFIIEVDGEKEYESIINLSAGASEVVMLGDFQSGAPGKLKIKNLPKTEINSEGEEIEIEGYTGYALNWRINDFQVAGVPLDG